MNLDTLIEILNDYREEFGGDAEVRLMTQQNWPFENSITGLVSGAEINESDGDDEADDAVGIPDVLTHDDDSFSDRAARRVRPLDA